MTEEELIERRQEAGRLAVIVKREMTAYRKQLAAHCAARDAHGKLRMEEDGDFAERIRRTAA